MLTGQAKTDYQREYMRRYRAKNKDSVIVVQKQRSENAPGLSTVAELRPVRPVRPAGELTKAKQLSSRGFNR